MAGKMQCVAGDGREDVEGDVEGGEMLEGIWYGGAILHGEWKGVDFFA